MDWKKARKDSDNKQTFQKPETWVFLHYYEALNLLFRIENSLRLFVYIILKEEYEDTWVDLNIETDESGNSTISAIAKQRLAQSRSFGYLGIEVQCPIMQLTSGELIRLITHDSYWKHFKPFFLGKKEIIRNKLDEIGAIRNALAHFRPITEEDVELIKHNTKHVLREIETFLSNALNQRNVVPTNTDENWYKELRTLGNDLVTITFQQSDSENWIQINLTYDCPVLTKNHVWKNYINYKVLSVETQSILNQEEAISNKCIYISEHVPFVNVNGSEVTPDIKQDVYLVFSRDTLKDDYKEIKNDIEDLLKELSNETDLIKQDNLARGELVNTAEVSVRGDQKEESDDIQWSVNTTNIYNKETPQDPPEYFGVIKYFPFGEYITKTHKFPWMTTSISEMELPF